MSLQEGLYYDDNVKIRRAWQCYVVVFLITSLLLLGAGACLGYVYFLGTIQSTPAPYGPRIIYKPQPRLPQYVWCVINFNESHVGWSANQPPQEWTRIFLPTGCWKQAIQITPYGANGNVTRAAKQSYIFEAYASFGVLYVGLEYWGGPWKLYIGGKTDPSFFGDHWKDEVTCNAAIYKGVPPLKLKT